MSVALTTRRRATARTRSSGCEAVDAGPQPEVRRRRPLRLQPGDPLERLRHREPVPAEEQLARERRAIQLAQGERPHGATIVGAAFAGIFELRWRTRTARCASCSSSSCSRSRACSPSISSRRRRRAPRSTTPARATAPKPAPRPSRSPSSGTAGSSACSASSRRADRPPRSRCGSSRRARRRPSVAAGIRTALPERARLRSLRSDAETWFASFSRSTFGPGSAETKRMRLWQIAATLAPHGEKEARGARRRGSVRDDAAPRRPARRLARRDRRERLPLRHARRPALGSPRSATSTGGTSAPRTTTSPSRRCSPSRAGRTSTARAR